MIATIFTFPFDLIRTQMTVQDRHTKVRALAPMGSLFTPAAPFVGVEVRPQYGRGCAPYYDGERRQGFVPRTRTYSVVYSALHCHTTGTLISCVNFSTLYRILSCSRPMILSRPGYASILVFNRAFLPSWAAGLRLPLVLRFADLPQKPHFLISFPVVQALTYPVDTVRRRMQMGEFKGRGMFSAFYSLLKAEGYRWACSACFVAVLTIYYRGLFRGILPTCLRVGPAVASGMLVRDHILGRI